MTAAPEVTVDGVDWAFGDSALLYDPRKRFPPGDLLALAREHARCPGLVHRELRRDMDSRAVARLFGLESVGDSGGRSGSSSIAGSVQDQQPAAAGYFTVEEESDEVEYVLVGTADEVERERRQEAGAEAALEAGWDDRVRSIEELLEEADVEVAARTARPNGDHLRSAEELLDDLHLGEDAVAARQSDGLVRDTDHRFLEEEAAAGAEWNVAFRTNERHFAC
ncbi:hypothetical protein PVAP13_7KG243455 [Panicum virgatum]|uniref:Uncharacterized protein n=1 Tax=Panicum virgatum TaxID=38727 RepID=A0A8T0QHW1_PANVG|nr:hypothetical protein PVAP13_7KG243455 [Panicum virgatum]